MSGIALATSAGQACIGMLDGNIVLGPAEMAGVGRVALDATRSRTSLRCASVSCGPRAMIGIWSSRSFFSEKREGVVEVSFGAPGTASDPLTKTPAGGVGA